MGTFQFTNRGVGGEYPERHGQPECQVSSFSLELVFMFHTQSIESNNYVNIVKKT